jgi:telomerase reverse transcriptase
VVPLLRDHFYVTETEAHRQRVFYFRKPIWAAITVAAKRGLAAGG